MSKLTSDVHESQPIVPISVSRVGIIGFKRPIKVNLDGKEYELVADLDVYVDVPATKKGAHMSRNIEAIEEIFENGGVNYLWDEIGEFVVKLGKKLMEKHPYATRVEVHMHTQIPIEKASPSRKVKSFDTVRILTAAKVKKKNNKMIVRKVLGVEVEGMTVCPNSIEMTKDYSRSKLREAGFSDEEIEKILELVPVSAHNQRGIGRLIVETNEDIILNLKDLIRILEDSMSSPVYPILKREDEQFMVIEAHRKPRFTEDVVRVAIGKLVEKFKDVIPGDSYITVSQRNFESIHSHDVYSEIRGCFSELEKELNG
ncbi:MAG: GTP cyclohydrolase MptA [Candidatus Njordarchaeia archaeon]